VVVVAAGVVWSSSAVGCNNTPVPTSSRLVPKELSNGAPEKDSIQYPCQVINRFQCPYETTKLRKIIVLQQQILISTWKTSLDYTKWPLLSKFR
jgi:hypothetical protein